MKPHKHAETIKAWADGGIIECKRHELDTWNLVVSPSWHEHFQYRMKPDAKPDFSLAYFANPSNPLEEDGPHIEWTGTWNKCNLKLTFDGETGELKAAEVLK